MRFSPRSLTFVAASLLLFACTSGETSSSGTAGTGGGAGTTGSAGTTGVAGTTGSAGTTGAAGTTGSAGTSAAAGSVGSTGSAGTTGVAGTTGAAGSTDGGAPNPDAGPTTTAGCAGKGYQLCIDFEDGIDTATWMGGTTKDIDATHAAHGSKSYHLYHSNPKTSAGRLLSKTVGTIKNQVWGRFYIHFSPGAPGGHGNIVAAYDQSNSWYEMGYQFDGMMGVWHAPGGAEHPRRSLPYIVDQWYCIETYFDGAAAAMPKWYINGAEATYYEPVKANGGKVGEAGPTPTVTTQFTRLEAGFTPYAGLELKQPDTVGDQSDTRVLQDLWIDDIAFDTKRIGCIQQ